MNILLKTVLIVFAFLGLIIASVGAGIENTNLLDIGAAVTGVVAALFYWFIWLSGE